MVPSNTLKSRRGRLGFIERFWSRDGVLFLWQWLNPELDFAHTLVFVSYLPCNLEANRCRLRGVDEINAQAGQMPVFDCQHMCARGQPPGTARKFHLNESQTGPKFGGSGEVGRDEFQFHVLLIQPND